MHTLILPALAAALMLAGGCHKRQQAHTPAASASQPGPSTVVARLENQDITLDEVDAQIEAKLREVEEQRYQIRRQALDQLINKRLVTMEAAKKGISEEAYLKQKVEDATLAITDAQIQEFFQQHKQELPPTATLAEFHDRIETYLARQARTDKAKDVFKSLRRDYEVVVHFAPPPKPRLQVEPAGPSRGPKDAKVTLVEFSDFECPFCGRSSKTVEAIMKNFDGKIRLVFRQFPLSFHSHAHKAAEAALCAHDQGKFWEYHNALFADQSKLDVPNLKETARQLKLNTSVFNQCLDSGKKTDAVKNDIAAAEKLGVSGTPAFFLNGMALSGAQPLEEFENLIAQELKL